MILPAWLDHVEKSFSFKEIQLKRFCLPVQTNCSLANENTEGHLGI